MFSNTNSGFCRHTQQECLPITSKQGRAYFLAHSDKSDLNDDLRPAVATVLKPEGLTAEQADHNALGRAVFCNSCLQVRASRLSVFDLPSPPRSALNDARLWIELGLAVANAVPVGLIARQGVAVPHLLAGADVFYYNGYLELQRRLPSLVASWLEKGNTGCPFCFKSHRPQRRQRLKRTFMLLPQQPGDPDLTDSVSLAMAEIGYESLSGRVSSNMALPICRLADTIYQQQLVLLDIGQDTDVDALVAIGLASGLGIPWLLLVASAVKELPSCLQGFHEVCYHSYKALRQQIADGIPEYLDRSRGSFLSLRRKRQLERARQEEVVRQAVHLTLQRYLADHAPNECRVFEEIVWPAMSVEKWTRESNSEEIFGPMGFADPERVQVGDESISMTATSLLLAAMKPSVLHGWLSVAEIIDRIEQLSANWRLSPKIANGLMQSVSSSLSASIRSANEDVE